jgi:DNA-binding CsgD family transcriptional regulator/tetratricopeptide (TPR) repeat protein/type II secretory pathway predicted ATPase ExeA
VREVRIRSATRLSSGGLAGLPSFYNQLMRRGILERDAELSVLANAVREAADRHGSVVLVMGEAGIGKSSLVEALRSRLPAGGRMLVGYCDDLATPRTLGPFRDLVGSVGTELSRAVADGSERDRVLTALRTELTWPEHPTVLVIEDVHWADDATLDALRYLIRRIADLSAVLVLTYRDDELNREHPLHGLLGQASRSAHIRYLPLRRLSQQAVRQLSAGSSVDAHDLFALTSGNPFFVHELLASAQGERVPPTITDAVLARVRSLDPATQDMLEQLAVVPSALDRWLVDVLVPGPGRGAVAALAAAEERGLLSVSTRKIAFRHELTRRAIAGSVPAARLMALNQRVLEALIEHDGSDVSRIVHHAAQAGDQDAIIGYGPAAGRDAAGAGAHREAVAHFGLVLEHEGRFPPSERAELLAQYAIECYTVGAIDKAVAAGQRAVDLNRSLGDLRQLGASLRWLSRIWWMAGNRANAERAGREAISVLEQVGDSRLLALAVSNESQLCMLAYRFAESIAYGERAAALAREADDAAVTAHALTNIGVSRWALGDPAGQATLDEALRVALEAGDVEDACRAYVNLVRNLLDWFRLEEAERYLTAAMKLAEDSEFFGILSYMQVMRARLEFARGSWDEAVRAAEAAVDAFLPARCPALVVLGRVQVRRGQPQAARLLSSAWKLAVQIDELQRLGPAAAARAEDAWLRGDHARVRDIATPVYHEARRLGDRVNQAELGYWLAKAGQPAETASDHPYALQAAGRWREAAAAWEAAGCRYEHAAALAESPEPDDLLTALGILDELGATPLAALVRRRLRALGTTRIPRGPRGETRVNPAGLTARQIDVLRLLGQGYTNAEIASQLVVSVRTVDSHVAAVLAKLGAASRREAAARAADLGVLDAENR